MFWEEGISISDKKDVEPDSSELPVRPALRDRLYDRSRIDWDHLLFSGQDLKKQLAGKDLGNALLLPCNMLRSGENVFLDDVTVEELSDHLQVPVRIVDSDGASFVKAIRLL